ncbi:O-methyltransferase [Salegentibacter chungangensis]|uniref:O-methyltransferase n=1 Tax=Salegentibacter chungangensis TaxID=1335724 RepID=A0ABW3NQF0_9FLAO
MYQLKAYIKFLLNSQNQHGLHSPFVYDLVTQCFYDKKQYPEYELLNEFRQGLLNNRETIQVTDFGAGSKVFKTSERPVCGIAKNVGVSPTRAKFLFRLTNYLKCKTALEVGTSLGLGASAIAANKQTRLLSIEGCPETANIARKQFEKFGLENIQLKIGEFSEVLDKDLTADHKFDLVYFDGNHQKEPTLKYFQQLLPYAHNDSVFIFDDIHWSPGMEAAWEEIKAHPDVKVSIDTFYQGLIFFRKEQAKQHFRIRL